MKLRVKLRPCGWVHLLLFLLVACRPEAEVGPCPDDPAGVRADPDRPWCERLSAYGVVTVVGGRPQPAGGSVPYDLATPLFTDYAAKLRTIWVPPGTQVHYTESGPFTFPVGTIITKSFGYPRDPSDPEGPWRLVETRLLVRRSDGWDAIAYLWDPEAREAEPAPLGAVVPLEVRLPGGAVTELTYLVPNVNQCRECHGQREGHGPGHAKRFEPLGPRAKHLAKPYAFGPEAGRDQLQVLAELGLLAGLPVTGPSGPVLVDAFDPAQPVTARARAYLDANCAHCHNPRGTAAGSGLMLAIEETEPVRWGYCKVPVRGVGEGVRYDVEPGAPERSAIYVRMASLDPKAMMPRIGKTLLHTEALALVRAWIATLPGACAAPAPATAQ